MYIRTCTIYGIIFPKSHTHTHARTHARTHTHTHTHTHTLMHAHVLTFQTKVTGAPGLHTEPYSIDNYTNSLCILKMSEVDYAYKLLIQIIFM